MIRFIYRLASSDVILLDDYYPEIYKPTYDKNVKVIQVWHACGAFKALGLERMSKAGHRQSIHPCINVIRMCRSARITPHFIIRKRLELELINFIR